MTPSRIAVVSGYFGPMHVGHVRLIRAAQALAPYLVVIVNNDQQQILKKGRLIIPAAERLEVVSAFAGVDEAFIAIDDDESVTDSLSDVRARYSDAEIVFGNGGDRSPTQASVPTRESEACERLRIEMVYGVGGEDKPDSSSRLIEQLGL